MRNEGLRFRFNEHDRYEWLYHHSCLVCRMNGWDALHHIVSPSSMLHVDGPHNASILNSCPIHNTKCHVGNEAYLYSEQTIRTLLSQTKMWLLDEYSYSLQPLDRAFLQVYSSLYG